MITNIGIRNTPEGWRSSSLIFRRIQEVGKKGRLVALPPAVSDKTETSMGDAFEPCRSYSTHSEEWKTMHPDRGARFLATWSRGVAPMTRGPGIASNPSTPPGCRTDCLTGKCDTLAGSEIFPRWSFPGSSALRASTPGLKSDDPSGASPLRDRQAIATGRGSVSEIVQRQRLSLLLLISSNASPLN